MRNEVQEPQEGPRVFTETFSPRRERDSEEQRRSSQGRREARGRRRREAGRQRGGGRTLERRSPREQRAGRRDHSSVAQRTSGGSKAQESGKGERGSVRPFEPTAGGQDCVERRGPSPRRGRLRRANPTSGRGMKQGRGGRGRSKAPGGRKNPEGATDRARQTRSWWAAAIASAEGARTPWERPYPRGSRRPVPVEL